MGEQDLPLLANVHDIRARHYMISLVPDLKNKMIHGHLVLFLEPTTPCEKNGKFCTKDCFCHYQVDDNEMTKHDVNSECLHFSSPQDESALNLNLDNCSNASKHGAKLQEFILVLDSCDTIIENVSEIVCEADEVNKFLSSVKTDEKSLPYWCSKNFVPLLFSTKKWCINIWKVGILQVAEFPRVVSIKYQTSPSGSSVMWRKDCDGNPCVFTAAAPINNRSLLPCQEPPSAMATWQSWVVVEKSNYVAMTGDAEPLLMNTQELEAVFHFVSNPDSVCYYYYTEVVLPIATIAIAIGQWSIFEVVTKDDSSCADAKFPLEIASSNFEFNLKLTVIKCQHYEYRCHLAQTNLGTLIPVRIICPQSMLGVCSSLTVSVPYLLKAAYCLLGQHPLPRLELVFLPKSFNGLGLASPNLIFLSPTLIADEFMFHIRLAHEICHSWFGINLGAQDWTEEWLSEGFATYLEDLVYTKAVQLVKSEMTNLPCQVQDIHCNITNADAAFQSFDALCHQSNSVYNCQLVCSNCKQCNYIGHIFIKNHGCFAQFSDEILFEMTQLRGQIRYKTLKAELENSSVSLQTLQPMHGEKLASGSNTNFIKDGLNPEKSFLQVHYLKGYFLLSYLASLVGQEKFMELILKYAHIFHGQLVLSEQFINLFLDTFGDGIPSKITKDLIYSDWLHNTALNSQTVKKHETFSNSLIVQVGEHMHYWELVLHESNFRKRRRLLLPSSFSFSDQLVLLLESVLELPSVAHTILSVMHDFYLIKSQNADVRHRWCELMIKHNFPNLSYVEHFLEHDQSMGIYLYSELMISGKRKHRRLAESLYAKLQDELDENVKRTIYAILHS